MIKIVLNCEQDEILTFILENLAFFQIFIQNLKNVRFLDCFYGLRGFKLLFKLNLKLFKLNFPENTSCDPFSYKSFKRSNYPANKCFLSYCKAKINLYPLVFLFCLFSSFSSSRMDTGKHNKLGLFRNEIFISDTFIILLPSLNIYFTNV